MRLPHRADAEGALRIFNSGNRSTTIHSTAANGTAALDDRGLFIPQLDGDGARLWVPGRTATKAENFVGLAYLPASLTAIREPGLQFIAGYQKRPTISQTWKAMPHPGADGADGNTQQVGNLGCRIAGTRPYATQVRLSCPFGQGRQPYAAYSDVERRFLLSSQASRSATS